MNISIPTIKLRLPAFLKRSEHAQSAASAPARRANRKWSALADRPLPAIGHWPVAQQFQTLLALLLAFLVLAAIFVFIDIRKSAQTAVYVSTATEMQCSRSASPTGAQQAARGTPLGFTQLQQSRDHHRRHGASCQRRRKAGGERPPSSSKIQTVAAGSEKLWGPVQANINLILSQRPSLIELRELETTSRRPALSSPCSPRSWW